MLVTMVTKYLQLDSTPCAGISGLGLEEDGGRSSVRVNYLCQVACRRHRGLMCAHEHNGGLVHALCVFDAFMPSPGKCPKAGSTLHIFVLASV